MRALVPFRFRRAALLAATFILALPPGVRPQADETSRSWNQPVEPYRILGNLYYVGASDVTAFLITGPKGHILLDSGFAETVPQITRNIAKLGFRVRDVRILLSSHAHFDHAGGLARLKKLTGARFYASEEDAAELARGGKGDYALGDSMPYEPVQADQIVRDGDRVTLGTSSLIARITPGHTKGCTTWTMVADEGGRKYDVVFTCSTTVLPNVSLTKNAAYPQIADDFARTFRTLKSLPCDVFLGNHGSFFDMTDKAARLARGERPNPFIDPAGYRAYIERMEKAYLERLEGEKKALTPAPSPAPPSPSPGEGAGE
jgi:metallo-beta-lactamase class B